MNTINKKIEITAEIKTVLGDINKTVNDLQTKLKQQNFDFSKNQNFAKMLTNYKDAYANFSNYVKNDSIDFLDAKDAIKSGEQVIKIFRQIQGQYGNLLDISEETAKKLFPEQFKANIAKAEQAIARFTKASNDLVAKSNEYNEATNELTRLRAEAEKIANTKIKSDFDEELESTKKKADEATKALEELYAKVGQRLYKKKTKGTSLENKTADSIEKEIDQAKLARSQEKEKFRNQKSNFKSLKAIEDHYDAAIANLRLQLKEAQEITKEIDAELDKVKGGDVKVLTKTEKNTYNQQAEEIARVEKETRDLTKAQQEAYATEKQRADAIEKSKRALSEQERKTQALSESVEKLRQASSIPDLFKQLQELNIPTDGIEQTAEGIQKISSNLSNINSQAYQQLIQSLKDTGKTADEAEAFVEQLRAELTGLGNSAKDIQRANTEMENLKNQVKTFFSITNSIQLLKRTVSSAIATVKELDATMTEAAVVTDFSVSDMWEKLPEYSSQAQKLGVSINGMYQATTLYYQQGLKNNEAMALGVETMKMAKIAGMETADATKAMTAALRGFNMELNETSATRVNDVYSELAAVTAADAGQIATAMGKTASIAASANMEFETTAALLAQIIETTQEAPETAGTAMKTIIARFSEVKSLAGQGISTGKDTEGEDIDVNKIQSALRTVGISMEDFFAGNEGLDSILLKLAEKWGTLDTETQRYIATMAAGSRQQSRFIAMMSDYGRTTELVAAANESAGSSQKQFEKTMDSMESKLTKLKNAWDEFAMGLANNEVLKFAVDVLTTIIETINKLTEAVSGGNGLSKSIVSLITVIGALKGGGAIFEKALGGIGQKWGLEGANPQQIPLKENGKQSVIKAIIKNPTREGDEAGEQAGRGFVAGFKRAISTQREGRSSEILKSFAINPTISKEDEEYNKKQLKKAQKLKTDFLANVWEGNQDKFNSNDLDFSKIEQAYDNIMQKGGSTKDAIQAVNYELQEMGGAAIEVGEDTEEFEVTLKEGTLDMQALGQATAGVGAALGLLSSLFNNLGWEPLAEATQTLSSIFMVMGTGISTLITIFHALGNIVTVEGGKMVIAGIETQLAWWWVFVIIGGIALLTVGIIALAKAAQANSLDGRMQAAAEATERAKEAAEEAKKAYDDLLSERNKYDELQKSFEGLTKGTQEWKQALVDANGQVLKLLATYPKLAQYLKRGEHGQLTISDAGWDWLINDQQQAVKNSTAAMLASQAKETQLGKEKIEETFRKKAYNIGIKKFTYVEDENGYIAKEDTSELDTEALRRIYEAYKENGADLFTKDMNGGYSQALKDLAQQTDQTVEEIYAMKDALAEYDSALVANETQLYAQTEAMLAGVASEEVLGYEFSEELLGTMAKGVADSQAAREDDIRKKIYASYGKSESKHNEYFKKIAEENGLTANDFTGKDKEDLETLYAKMAGIEKDKIAAGLKGNKEALAAEIAKMQAAKEAGLEIEKTYEKLKNLSKEAQKIYLAGLSGKTNSLSRGEAKNLASYTNENLETMAKDMGYETVRDLAIAQGYEDVLDETGQVIKTAEQKMLEFIKNTGETAIADFEEIKKKAEQMGLDPDIFDKGYLEKANNAQLNAFSKLMSQALGAGGREGAESFQKNFDAVMASASLDQQNLILNALGTFDFSKAGESERFMEYLRSINVYLPADLVKSFTKDLNKLSEAFERLDISTLRDELKELLDLADDFYSREDSQGLTQEERDQMIKYGLAEEEDFAWNGQTWLYLEGPLVDLKKAIEANTEAILAEKREKIADQIEKGEKLQTILNEKREGEFIKYQTYEASSGAYVDHKISYNDFMAGNITDVDVLRRILGLHGSDLTDAEVVNYYQEAIFAYKNLGVNKESLEALNSQSQFMTNTNLSPMLMGDTTSRVTYTGIDGPAEEQQVQLVAMAREYGVSQATIKQFTEAMKTSNAEVRNAATTALKNAIEQNRQDQAYSRTIDTLSDLGEKYGNITEGMRGYAEAVNSFGYALGLNMLESSNIEFVKTHFEEIKKAAEGDIDAIVKLQQEMAALYGLTLNENGSFSLTNAGALQNPAVQAYIANQIATGAYEVVETEITTETAGNYITLDSNGNFVYERADQGDIIRTLQARDPSELQQLFGVEEDFEWENPYDKYYETVQDINAELRERERLEKEYQRLARRTNSSVIDLNKNREQRLARLDSERELREGLLANRKGQMSDLEKEYSKFSKYARYDEDTGTIDMNWDLINKLEENGDEETVKALEEYISKLEEYQGYIQEEEDALDEIKDTVYDIYQEGKDEYFDLEDQVKNALIEARQEEIDKLSAINDSINNSNSQIVAAMQESIAQRRQERDNEKTEQELTDKRRRLMYLQMDTSNANDLEVLKLQKEIAEGEEDYTDQLIDQKISEIQDQNEKAAEQRQAQIEILQAQLEYYQKYDIWKDVEKLIAEGLGENGVIEGTELWHILTQSDEYLTVSKLRKEGWVQDLQSMARAALSWLEMGRSSRAAFSAGDIVKGQEISFYDKNNNLLTGKVDENGYIVVDDKKYEVFEGEDGKWYAKKYAMGGLADFTGPAWLDGTKSKPEYVLNASQTQAFLSLVDVLEHFDRGFGNTSTENFGDNIIDIDINIETVKEEADVDMLAEKIQQSIISSARYRNNNFIQR